MGKLSVRNVSKNYGEKKALSNLSIEVKGGEIVGLIGKNGAGKTTLLNIIAGNIYCDSGAIYYDDINILENNEPRKDFGILIEPAFLDYLNTERNLQLLQNAMGIWDKKYIRSRTKEVLEIVGLAGKEKKYVKSFSFGMKQRLGFAQALLNGNKLLILDEPFVGLDIKGREMVKEYVKQYARTNNVAVIFSDHNLDEVRSLCDRVAVIADGEKKYDGEVYSRKKYEITVSNINEALIRDIERLSDSFIEMVDNKIVLNNKDSINEVIALLGENTVIKDVNIIDDSLERFFEA
ncbi:MAG: ABC transporter ATP-binding protein [Pseudobutyrivibrio sp.]|nr:ABC transporter ATP-binding protein [Pseudobutyrivibrio sp.]